MSYNPMGGDRAKIEMCGSAICFEGFGEEWVDFYVAGIENCDIRIAKGQARGWMVCSGYRNGYPERRRVGKAVEKKRKNSRKMTNCARMWSRKIP